MKSFLLFSIFLVGSGAKRFIEPPIILNEEQRELLAKFKQSAFANIPNNTHIYEFARDDLYPVKWLHACSWDLPTATKAFSEHLKWREAEKIEGIDNENWDDFESEYEVRLDGWDKKGGPVAEMTVAEWDVRRAVVAGKRKRILRWITRLYELQERRLYRGRVEGKNITQALLLVDIINFNTRVHACKACLTTYEHFGWVMENHYPLIFENIFGINSTPAFQMMVSAIRPFLKEDTKNVVQLYTSKKAWQPVLDAKIDRSQRSCRYGGTKSRD